MRSGAATLNLWYFSISSSILRWCFRGSLDFEKYGGCCARALIQFIFDILLLIISDKYLENCIKILSYSSRSSRFENCQNQRRKKINRFFFMQTIQIPNNNITHTTLVIIIFIRSDQCVALNSRVKKNTNRERSVRPHFLLRTFSRSLIKMTVPNLKLTIASTTDDQLW